MRVVKYHTPEGVFHVLLTKEGRKWLHILQMDSTGLRLRRVRTAERSYMADTDYPTSKAIDHFLDAGKRFGITDSAKYTLTTEGAKT